MAPDAEDKLQALLRQKLLLRGKEWQQRVSAEREKRQAGEYDLERIVPGRTISDGESGFYLVVSDYPLDHEQGAVALGKALTAGAEDVRLVACDEELHAFHVRRACFVDTETLGLSGGTGTVCFLIGIGYFTETAFRLEQCFMRDYDDEEAMLRYVAERLRRFESLVSFNGKSFDLPLLRTRCILHRIPCAVDALLHFDLVHASRRLWKRRLQDCSLTNLERQLLGLERRGDVPSALIPQLWLDYLRTRDARPLQRVFYHHAMDILSLVSLTAWVSEVLQQAEREGLVHSEDALSLVRLHYRQKNYESVLQFGKQFLEQHERSPLRQECLHFLSDAAKRLGRWEEAAEHLTLLTQEFPSDLKARLDLCKVYEHALRNLPRALELCREIFSYYGIAAEDMDKVPTEYPEMVGLWRRYQRLQKKLQRGSKRIQQDFGEFTSDDETAASEE